MKPATAWCPYTEEAYALGFPTGIVVSGDHDISVRMDHLNLPHCYLEYPGDDHVGYLTYDPVNSLNFVFGFLASEVCGQPLPCSSATAVGIEDVAASSDLAPYPVPADDHITLDLQEAALVTLLDGQGRTVWRQQLRAGVQRIATGELPDGIYLLRSEGRALRTARLVIAR
jgi:hypothetical protein